MKKALSVGLLLLSALCWQAARVRAEEALLPGVQQEEVKEAGTKSARKPSKAKTAKTAQTAPAASTSKSAADAQPQSGLNENQADAKTAATYYEIGMGHYESKRFKDAVEAFKQAIRLGSNDPKTYFNLGQAYYSLNLYKEAREAYKRAVKVKPDWAEAHYRLGWMYHLLGNKDSALEQYKLLQTLNPEMAASFQKLLDDDEKAASNNASNKNTTTSAANGAGTASTNPTTNATTTASNNTTDPQTTTTEAGAAVRTQDPAAAPASAGPDNSDKQSPASETKTGPTGTSVAVNPEARGSTIASANPSGGTPNSNASDASPKDASPISTTENSGKSEAPTAAASSELPLTSVYRVGVGDVLDIRLLNSLSGRSTLFTVLSGGAVEYPLVGGSFQVAGLTTDEIAARLTAELKRRGISETQLAVGVRDYTSHAVIVSGLVNYPGTKILRREAVPLYVIVAEAQPRPDASRAVIMRASESIPVNDLSDPAALNVLVRPGDVITLNPRQLQYYFIGGRINSPGQKPFQPGLTLIQAILAAGGLSRSQETVEISREEPDGRLTTTKYVLKEIKSGKIPDPHLQPGDRIQVGH
ncbi:MAG TPA: tetratricopeptide repeat protein [Pyrinomonadaceae bacterium]|jgi:protein involved in polysaccharide export with SLBB domain